MLNVKLLMLPNGGKAKLSAGFLRYLQPILSWTVARIEQSHHDAVRFSTVAGIYLNSQHLHAGKKPKKEPCLLYHSFSTPSPSHAVGPHLLPFGHLHPSDYNIDIPSWTYRKHLGHKPARLTSFGAHSHHFNTEQTPLNKLHSLQLRQKSTKKKQGSDGVESDSDGDEPLEEDDFEAPAKFKVTKINVTSLRADSIISNSLDVARNRLDELFFSKGLLLNGEKMAKKAVKLEEGDYVDLVVEKLDDQLKVKRVKVIKVYPEKSSKDKFIVKVRTWKTPFVISHVEDRPGS